MRTQTPVNLALELVPGSPIRGKLAGVAGETEFVGWSELVAGVKRAVDESESRERAAKGDEA